MTDHTNMKYIFRTATLLSLGALLGVSYAFSLPSQVTGVQVNQVENGSVRVNWQEAESAEDIIIGYRVYFGTTSVQEEGDTYDDEVVVYGGVETTIEGLLPKTTYYFAVTALDSEENASENYSAEVSLLLSEEVAVEPTCTDEIKNGTETDIDCGGTCEACVPLEIEKEIACKDLPEKLTACEAYECAFAHPITREELVRTISGIVEGTCRYKETISQDKWMECRFLEEKHVAMGKYYEDVMSGKNTENLLGKSLQSGECAILEGLGAVFPEEEVLPEKEEFGPEKPEEFKSAAPDTTAPMEALNLSVDTAKIKSDGIALLSWEKSLDLDNDVTDQILYLREELGSWDNGYSIGKTTETLELDVEAGKNYEFKVATTDAAENSTESRVYSFSTKLTESGPASMYGVLLAIIALGIFALFSARRRA